MLRTLPQLFGGLEVQDEGTEGRVWRLNLGLNRNSPGDIEASKQ